MAVAAVLGGVLALVLFMVVPTALAGLLARFVPLGGWRALIEGVFKLVMLGGLHGPGQPHEGDCPHVPLPWRGA